MPSTTLSTATIDLIASYGNTAHHVIDAYRASGDRVLGLMDRRWASALKKSADQLAPEVRGNALALQRKFSGYASRGIALTTGTADVAVSKVVEIAGKGVRQAAAGAAAFGKRTGVHALDTMASAALPAAVTVSKLAATVEQRSRQLAKRIAGTHAAVRATTAKRSSAFAKARARKAA